MTRKKLKIAFIENDPARKATYKTRKKGLVKKVDELSTLCGVDACAIIYGPYNAQPEIWPSPSGVEKVLSKFMTVPEFEQRIKMANQESFLKQRVSKFEKQFERQVRDNKEQEKTLLMFQCLNAANIVHNNMSMEDLSNLDWIIDKNLKEIGRRIESAKCENSIHQNQSERQVYLQRTPPLALPPPPSPLPLLPPPPPPPTAPTNDNDDIMYMDMVLNGGGIGTIPFGYDAHLYNGISPNLLS
ncbi:unnamed protein product [Lathyrus sativus]|nr:unnamed protein product [Lathyrus sativus]